MALARQLDNTEVRRPAPARSPDSLRHVPNQHLDNSGRPDDSSSTSSVTEDPEKGAVLLQPQPSPEDDGVSKDLVEFTGPNDPGNPQAWSRPRRWAITISLALMVFVVTFSSSIFSVAIQPVSKEYHCSTVVSTLGVSLFLLVSDSWINFDEMC